jgi:hypothetical protein
MLMCVKEVSSMGMHQRRLIVSFFRFLPRGEKHALEL